MENMPEQEKGAEYYAEMARRFELHKQAGGTVFDFNPDRPAAGPAPARNSDARESIVKPRPGRTGRPG